MTMLDTFLGDVKYAARSLRRTPGFTAAALVTLALGIGANTAIFSLVEAVMLRTLPIRAPQQLQFIAHGEGDDVSTSSNFGWYERVQQETGIFEGVAAYNTRSFKIAGDDGIEQVVGQYASGNYHALLGVPMALGRGFASERDRAAGSSPYAVISAACGCGIGIVGAAAVSLVMRSQFYGASTIDPLAFDGSVGLMLLTMLLASVIPAARAARVDPAVALRAD